MSPKKIPSLFKKSVGALMAQRLMVGRTGRDMYGLAVEETVALLHVRVAGWEGRLLTATALADEARVNRRTVGRTLKKLEKLELITSWHKGREVLYDNPPNLTLKAWDAYAGLVVDQIAVGDELKTMVAALKDDALKARIVNAVNAAKLSASRLT